MKTLTIAPRFCGPPASANGGYFAGLLAALAARTVTGAPDAAAAARYALRRQELPDGGAAGAARRARAIGEARPAALSARGAAPRPITSRRWRPRAAMPASAITASRPASCAARSARAATACASLPVPRRSAAWWRRRGSRDASLEAATARCAPSSCRRRSIAPATTRSRADDRMMLLAEFTAHVDRRVHVGESVHVVGWQIGSAAASTRRALRSSTAEGELCGRARALWIEPRERRRLLANWLGFGSPAGSASSPRRSARRR